MSKTTPELLKQLQQKYHTDTERLIASWSVITDENKETLEQVLLYMMYTGEFPPANRHLVDMFGKAMARMVTELDLRAAGLWDDRPLTNPIKLYELLSQ